MVTRKLLTAVTAGMAASLLAQHAVGAEVPVARKSPVAIEHVVDVATFRADIEAYVQAVNEQLRATFREELRRELADKTLLATNELRTRG